jgi:hypothetical protein
MPTWFNWSPLAPLLKSYADDGTRDLCTAEICIKTTGDFKISLVGEKHAIELIRVATLNSDGNLTPLQAETVTKLVDHMLAVLKLTYDPAIDLVRFGENAISLGAHDVNGRPNLHVQIDEVIGALPEVPADNIRNVLVASAQHRHLIKLLADVQTPALPLQYRYLSLYKILELEFRTARRWGTAFDKTMTAYAAEYRKLNISHQTLTNLIHAMRDKCAHIKTGGKDSLGIVGLDGLDAKIVIALMPLLMKIITTYLNEKYSHLMTFGNARAFPPPSSTLTNMSGVDRA